MKGLTFNSDGQTFNQRHNINRSSYCVLHNKHKKKPPTMTYTVKRYIMCSASNIQIKSQIKYLALCLGYHHTKWKQQCGSGYTLTFLISR